MENNRQSKKQAINSAQIEQLRAEIENLNAARKFHLLGYLALVTLSFLIIFYFRAEIGGIDELAVTAFFAIIICLLIISIIRSVYPIALISNNIECFDCGSNLLLNCSWYCKGSTCNKENNAGAFRGLLPTHSRTAIEACRFCDIRPPAIICKNCGSLNIIDHHHFEENERYSIEIPSIPRIKKFNSRNIN